MELSYQRGPCYGHDDQCSDLADILPFNTPGWFREGVEESWESGLHPKHTTPTKLKMDLGNEREEKKKKSNVQSCWTTMHSWLITLSLSCLCSLTTSSSALSIPVDVPTMWDPSATPDPSVPLPAEVATQQLQVMSSVVLALLSEPFCKYHVHYRVMLANTSVNRFTTNEFQNCVTLSKTLLWTKLENQLGPLLRITEISFNHFPPQKWMIQDS